MPELDQLSALRKREPEVVNTVRVDEVSVRRLCEVYGIAEFDRYRPVPWAWLHWLVRPRPVRLDDSRPAAPLAELGSMVNGGLRIVPLHHVFIGDQVTLLETVHEVDVKERRGRRLTIVTTRRTVTRESIECVQYDQTAIYRGDLP